MVSLIFFMAVPATIRCPVTPLALCLAEPGMTPTTSPLLSQAFLGNGGEDYDAVYVQTASFSSASEIENFVRSIVPNYADVAARLIYPQCVWTSLQKLIFEFS
jgi:hypothetical protein